MVTARAALVWTLVAWGTCICPAQVGGPPASAQNGPRGAAMPAAGSTPVAPTGLSALAGLRVHDIEFRGALPLDAERLRELMAQKVNQPLSKVKLRQSIQALYATGRFADIQVEAERAPGNEVSLVFVAQDNYFVGGLSLSGRPRHGPTYRQLIDGTKLQLGELFTPEKIRRGMESMKRVLEGGGYYHATIGAQYQRHPEAHQIDIHFQITPGEQARIGRIVVTGDPGYSAEQISELAKFNPGDPVSAARVTRALQRIRKRFQKQDRLEAQVAITEKTYQPQSNTVDYVFDIAQGPTVDIRLHGARLRHGLVKKYVPVYEENAVDEDLLNEGRRNLRDYFQSQGYFDVNVEVKQQKQAQAGQRIVTYDIDRGERHKLVRLDLEGNKYFDDDLIRERLLIQPAAGPLSHGQFSQSMLARDAQSIESLYQANGFRQVKVRAEVQDDYQGEKRRMRVVLHIVEGPQTRVASLKITGNQSIAEHELRDLLSNIEGQPFSDFSLASDRDSVINHYFNHGFPEASFDASAAPVPGDATRMNVSYRITEGERVYVHQVRITGLQHTRPFVVDRELLIHDGDPLSQADMLETQRRLYDLGIFSQVNIAVQNPDGQARQKDVLLDLEEARRYTFTYGLGFEVQTGSTPSTSQPQGRTGFSPRVSFDVTRTNFRGRNHTIFFKSHVGRLQQRALLSYEAPRWFNRENLKLTFSTFYDTTRDVRTFTGQRLEGSVQAEQSFSKATTLLYRFTYRRVKVSDVVVSPDKIPLLSRPVRVGMPSFTFIRDTRDDPIETHKGAYTIFDAGVSSRIFGSQASFTRFLVQNSTYHPFGKGKYVFARSTRLGIEQPLGQGTVIPLPELFFAGGGNSHRGFAISQAGPRDLITGFPLGGEAMFINNLELRLPPLTVPILGDKVSPVIFHDMGNVFANTGDVFSSLLRVAQRSQAQCRSTDPSVNSKCEFNYTSHAIGAGVRYKTPIGPVRVDFGYNLNPPSFPVATCGTFGTPPCGLVPTFRSETLKHFNFYFSIGQTF